MSDQFKAIVLNQEGENFSREVKSLDRSFLKHGDVTVQVEYSDLNFKDGMILKNGGRLVKEYPHIPGIDFSGKVIESENSKFKSGDEVILTGFRVGEVFFGGYSQIAKVNADLISSLFTNFVFENSSPASIFSIGAEPPELSQGSNEVGLIVTHFFASLLLTVAKAFPA